MIGKSENVSEKKTKQNKPIWDKVKTVCCAVVSFLMIFVIVINAILIVKINIFNQEAPDVFGFFPLISLTDELSPRIEIGDLVLCSKIDSDHSGEIAGGEFVAHFPNHRRDIMYISAVESVGSNTVLNPVNSFSQVGLRQNEVMCRTPAAERLSLLSVLLLLLYRT